MNYLKKKKASIMIIFSRKISHYQYTIRLQITIKFLGNQIHNNICMQQWKINFNYHFLKHIPYW